MTRQEETEYTMLDLSSSVAVVTGANRGLGREFARQLVELGATVFAGARNPASLDVPGATPLPLDITDPDQVAEAARIASDANLVINNAGVSTFARLVDGDLADIRKEMETNYFGTLHMVRAFAPVLKISGRGAFLNVSSVMAWLGYEHSNTYGASKAAVWALSNGLRAELSGDGIQVSSLFLASTDTDMMADVDVPKNDPADVVRIALEGLAAGEQEILADQAAVDLKATLSQDRGRFSGAR
ncbi:SDR family oxidoreductase [Rothia koreensis]|uniref:SDR family oxidoreductase n=1 Tax=Rothia koreensis TaxID=592378 RepID=UPI001EE936DA|nr:SDR family oxidoreductase [Rothia koreensis]